MVVLSRTHRYTGYGDGLLVNPDRVLELNHGEWDADLLDIYDRILRKDAHLFSLFQTRKHMILSKDFEIHPASGEKRDIIIADFVKWQLYDRITNFTQDLYELLSAFQYGFSVSEFIFTEDKNRWIIDKIKSKHPSHFGFDEHGTLYQVSENGVMKKFLHPNKFIIHRHGGNDENPHGESLISERLYWLYYFKKNILQFLSFFIERFGSPTPIFSYPPGTSDEEHKVIDEMMEAFHNEMSIKLPSGIMTQLLEWKTTGNANVHERAIKLFNNEMSKGVLGQTLTSETQDTGSKAQATVHFNVLASIIKFDCRSLEATVNHQLIRPLVRWNFGEVENYPYMRFKTEPEKDLESLSKRDKNLSGILDPQGKRLSTEYITETYGVQVEEKSEEEKSKPQKLEEKLNQLQIQLDDFINSKEKKEKSENELEKEEPENFAEKEKEDEDDLLLEQDQELQYYIDLAVEKAISAQERFNKKLKKLIKKQESFKGLKALWKKILNPKKEDLTIENQIYREDVEPLANILGDILFFAYNLGEAHILNHYDRLSQFAEIEDDFTFKEAVNYFKNLVPKSYEEFLAERDKLQDKSFYISRVNEKSLIDGIKDRIEEAVKGKPFYKVKKSINQLFDDMGVTRLSPHHLDTVIRTNVLTAYSQGQLSRLNTPEMRKAFPYWRYVAVMDRRTRLSHQRLHGLTLPNDDPRWGVIYPPWSWGCRCRVAPTSESYFKRKGLPEPKNGELNFIYNQKDEALKLPITDSKGDIVKGKRNYNTQIIKEKDFDFPQPEKGFKNRSKDVFRINSKVHGDNPGNFGVKASSKNKVYEKVKHLFSTTK